MNTHAKTSTCMYYTTLNSIPNYDDFYAVSISLNLFKNKIVSKFDLNYL